MEHFVVDNSVVMSWCFKDENSSYADRVLDSLKGAVAVVPSIWPLEVVNVLLVAERKKRLSQSESVRFITLLTKLPIVVEHERQQRMMNHLLSLARTAHLSSYDASYLDLAMRQGLALASKDKGLIAAAREMAVPIWQQA